MAFAEVVKTSVAKNRPSQDSVNQMIIFNQVVLLLGSNHFLMKSCPHEEKLAQVNAGDCALYLDDPTHIIFTRIWQELCSGKLRMRKQNAKTTVPLDVVPERRTKRFPPRFRPVGRFCELRFRYLSSPTGREGEISRPLDHMRHIPLIHSARLIDGTNFYIYTTAFQLCLPNGTGKCVLVWRV